MTNNQKAQPSGFDSSAQRPLASTINSLDRGSCYQDLSSEPRVVSDSENALAAEQPSHLATEILQRINNMDTVKEAAAEEQAEDQKS